MSLSKTFCNLLSPFVESYKEAKNQKELKSIIKNAVDAVLDNRDMMEEPGELPSDLPTVSSLIGSCVYRNY